MKNKITVAWLCPYPVNRLPQDLTGVDVSKVFHPATWLINLSQALVKRDDIDLHILAQTPWVLKDSNFRHEGITFHILRSSYSVPFLKRGLPSWLLAGVGTKFWLDVKKFRKVLKTIHPDVVHAHGTEFQYAHSAVHSGYPAVVTLQGVIGFLKKILKGKTWDLQEKIEQDDIRRGGFFISHADFATEYVKKINPSADVRYIDDIVSESFFKRQRIPEPRKLLFVGSVLKTKGISDLIEACNIIGRSTEFTLTIVGQCEDQYKTELNSQIQAFGLQGKVLFTGHTIAEALFKEYETAGIFVFPSHFETSPNVIMEAMSMGLPIVTTRVGGIPDMITHQKTGLLVEANKPRELAQAVSELLKNPEQAIQLGRNARQAAEERFRGDIVTQKIVEYYYDIVGSRKVL